LKIKCRGKVFEVYELEEALEKGIMPIKNWRQAVSGDWIRTNDDKVVQVISTRKENPSNVVKEYLFIKTGFGDYPAHRTKIYSGIQKSYEDYRYSGRELIKNVRPTTLQKAFVDNLFLSRDVNAQGMWNVESVVSAYQSVFSDNNPEQALRRGMGILRKKHIKEYISMNMRDKLIESGLDDDFIAEKYKGMIEDGTVPPATKLNALNRVSDMLGHMAKEKKEESIEGVFALTDGDIKKLSTVRQKFAQENYVLENIRDSN
jgi:hypothetical protein